MHQSSAGLQKTISYGSTSSSIDTEIVWQLCNSGMHLWEEKQWQSSCEWWGCTAGEATFQGNLCGKEAVSWRCLKQLCGKFCANGCACNLTVPRYQTVGLGELELQMKWPPRSPDLTPRDTFLWGYVKEQVFVPPLPMDIDELKLRITAASRQLTGTWDELDYRLGHEWSSHWPSLGYVKLPEFVIQMARVTTV
jgi:hypothetical protein